MSWRCGRFEYDLKRPLIMGVLNITPDSFSDGGRYASVDQAISRAESMMQAGVDILDIGAESSRPNAQPVSETEELNRLLPIIEGLQHRSVAISIDTYKPNVMRTAIDLGVDMINDIRGFQDAASLAAVAKANCGLCIMHMQGNPQTMQTSPAYTDVVTDVMHFFEQRLLAIQAAAIDLARVCLDPGIGFGKQLQHNIALLQAIPHFKVLNLPLLIGLSRKSMLGEITGQPIEQRMAASIAGGLAAITLGASVIRVHDVAETHDALKVWRACMANVSANN